MSAEPLWDLIEEHFDDAVFLWSQWERALVSPDYRLSDLAARDEPRLLANVDALVLAGAAAQQRLLLPALESEQGHLITPAAYALLCTGSAPLRQLVLDGLQGPAPTRHAIKRSLQVYEGSDTHQALRELVSTAEAEVRAAALEVLTYHGQKPNEALWQLPSDGSVELAIAVLRAMRLDLRNSREPLVLAALEADEPRLRDEGLLTGIALELDQAWKLCRDLVHQRDRQARVALMCLAIAGDEHDRDALQTALRTPHTAADTLWALGFGGRVFGVSQCLATLREPPEPELAALAGEGFLAITAMPLAAALPEAPPPAEPTGELSVELPAPRPEQELPLLDAEGVDRWWDQNRHRFDDNQRYLGGQRYGHQAVVQALTEHPLRRRHALAVEWMLRNDGRARVHTRALTGRQMRDLASLSRRSHPTS